MAVNWTAFEAAAEAELDDKRDARAADITADLLTGITTYFTKIQDYVADEAAARTSLTSLLTSLSSNITTNSELPSADTLAGLLPSGDLTLILGTLEDEYEAGVVKTVDEVIDDKLPNIQS